MQKPEDTTTGEVICSTCGYLHNEGTACPNYTIFDPAGMLKGMVIGKQVKSSALYKEGAD